MTKPFLVYLVCFQRQPIHCTRGPEYGASIYDVKFSDMSEIHILWACSFGIGFSFTAPHFVRMLCMGAPKGHARRSAEARFRNLPTLFNARSYTPRASGRREGAMSLPCNSRNLHHEPQRHSLAIAQPRRGRSHKRWSVAMSGRARGRRDVGNTKQHQ